MDLMIKAEHKDKALDIINVLGEELGTENGLSVLISCLSVAIAYNKDSDEVEIAVLKEIPETVQMHRDIKKKLMKVLPHMNGNSNVVLRFTD